MQSASCGDLGFSPSTVTAFIVFCWCFLASVMPFWHVLFIAYTPSLIYSLQFYTDGKHVMALPHFNTRWYDLFPWQHHTFSNGNQNRATKEGWLWLRLWLSESNAYSWCCRFFPSAVLCDVPDQVLLWYISSTLLYSQYSLNSITLGRWRSSSLYHMVERQSSAYNSCLMLRVRGTAAVVVVYAAHTHTHTSRGSGCFD